jgi:pimeloyl-ACP methyl ester carboxylesterase
MVLASRTWGSDSDPIALLVHGAIDDSNTWRRVGPWLAERGFHVIAVDMPGHGKSRVDAGINEPSIGAIAKALADTVQAMRPDARGVALLIGHSLGSRVALACAAEYPGFVQRLVLEDGPGGPSTHDFPAIAQQVRAWILWAREDPKAMFEAWRATPPFPDPPPTEQELRERIAAVAATDPEYATELIARYTEPFSDGARCRAKTLVLVGRKELGSELTGTDRDRFMATLSDGVVMEIEGAHHLHHVNTKEFLACLAKWLPPGAPDPLASS